MARAPKADLGTMTISKAAAADTAPFSTAPALPPAAPAGSATSKSLTVKLDGDLYAALRTYCYEQERSTGSRLTHQQVMVTALRTLLSAAS